MISDSCPVPFSCPSCSKEPTRVTVEWLSRLRSTIHSTNGRVRLQLADRCEGWKRSVSWITRLEITAYHMWRYGSNPNFSDLCQKEPPELIRQLGHLLIQKARNPTAWSGDIAPEAVSVWTHHLLEKGGAVEPLITIAYLFPDQFVSLMDYQEFGKVVEPLDLSDHNVRLFLGACSGKFFASLDSDKGFDYETTQAICRFLGEGKGLAVASMQFGSSIHLDRMQLGRVKKRAAVRPLPFSIDRLSIDDMDPVVTLLNRLPKPVVCSVESTTLAHQIAVLAATTGHDDLITWIGRADYGMPIDPAGQCVGQALLHDRLPHALATLRQVRMAGHLARSGGVEAVLSVQGLGYIGDLIADQRLDEVIAFFNDHPEWRNRAITADGRTALHHLVDWCNGQPDLVLLPTRELTGLVLSGHSVNIIDNSGRTPFAACPKKRTEVLECLESGTVVVHPERRLIPAIQGRRLEEVRSLLNSGCSVGRQGNDSPLQKALMPLEYEDERALEIATLLVAKGADPHTVVEHKAGTTLLEQFRGRLREIGPPAWRERLEELAGNMDRIERPRPLTPRAGGGSAREGRAQRSGLATGRRGSKKERREKSDPSFKKRLDSVTSDGRVPIWRAIFFGGPLQSLETDTSGWVPKQQVRTPDRHGDIPLTAAIVTERTDVFWQLVTIDSTSIDVANREGWTPFHYAALKGAKSYAMMSSLGAQQLEDKWGTTPEEIRRWKPELNRAFKPLPDDLPAIIERGEVATIMRWLLDGGSIDDLVDAGGLHYAAFYGQTMLATVLVMAGGDYWYEMDFTVDGRGGHQRNPEDVAIENQLITFQSDLKLLVSNEPVEERRDVQAFLSGVRVGNFKQVHEMLARHPSLANYRQRGSGDRPLHSVARAAPVKGLMLTALYLLQAGGDPTVFNARGETACGLASSALQQVLSTVSTLTGTSRADYLAAKVVEYTPKASTSPSFSPFLRRRKVTDDK